LSDSAPHPKRAATYDDVVTAPADKIAEILNGELVLSPRPGPRHALAASAVGADLFGAFGRRSGGGGPGGWWILYEPELHLGDDVVVPDLAGWRRERLPALPQEAHFTLAPDWACEVISPRSASVDRVRKMRIYAREGVPNLWLVDPLGRTLEVFRLEQRRWVLVDTHAENDVVRAEPFGSVALALADWWGDVPDEVSPRRERGSAVEPDPEE